MQQIEKNTVDSKNQLSSNDYIRFIQPEHDGIKILFLGNSITLHGIKPEIGWHNEWGMAASAKENDYVHIVMRKVNEANPHASFCICQGSRWEREYTKRDVIFPQYETARNFGADIIVMRLMENVSTKELNINVLEEELEACLDYLSNGKKVKIIFTTSFWKHPGDDAVRSLAQKTSSRLIELGELGELDEMKALGLFQHRGVANHPGDKGMQEIADRIWLALRSMI